MKRKRFDEKEWSHIAKDDWIWLAGFFDGEGCIQLNKGSPAAMGHCVTDGARLVLRISVANTDFAAMRFIARTWKTSNYEQEPMGRGKRRTMHAYWYNWRAYFALKRMLPYLRTVRRAQARIAVVFQESKRTKSAGQHAPLTDAESAFRMRCAEKIVALRNRDRVDGSVLAHPNHRPDKSEGPRYRKPRSDRGQRRALK